MLRKLKQGSWLSARQQLLSCHNDQLFCTTYRPAKPLPPPDAACKCLQATGGSSAYTPSMRR
jgi:hypothetical protein